MPYLAPDWQYVPLPGPQAVVATRAMASARIFMRALGAIAVPPTIAASLDARVNDGPHSHCDPFQPLTSARRNARAASRTPSAVLAWATK